MFVEVLALVLGLQTPIPQQVPPPSASRPAGCDVRVQAVEFRTGQPIVGAQVRLRDLAAASRGKRSIRGKTGPDGLVCFSEQRPLNDGLLINANSLQYRDPGPELLIATRPQELTVHLRHRHWWAYPRYLLIGD